MGLFSNNKKPCPICGNATPRLLPTKVEGVPICKECDKKIDLPNGVLDSMTLDDFRRYIDFYNKNQVLRERFHPEYRFGFGAFNTQLVLDVTNGLFRLKDDEMIDELSKIMSGSEDTAGSTDGAADAGTDSGN